MWQCAPPVFSLAIIHQTALSITDRMNRRWPFIYLVRSLYGRGVTSQVFGHLADWASLFFVERGTWRVRLEQLDLWGAQKKLQTADLRRPGTRTICESR